MTESACLDVAEQALAAMPPADGALATVTAERSLLLRYARSRPTQATAIDDTSVELVALRDGHVGRASTGRSDEPALRDCAARALAAAAAAARCAGPGAYPGFPAVADPPRAHEGHDPDTARLDAGRGGAALDAAFAAAELAGVEAHGTWTAGEVETAIASTSGAAFAERVTDAFMKVVCLAPGGRSGYAAATGVSVDAIDAPALAERAAGKASAKGEQATLGPGEHAVVMEHHAVAALLEALAATAFDGLAHAEGRGALAGRLGTRVAAPAVNLSDSPRYPGTLPRGFDAEGLPKAPRPLIQDGVAQGVAHDTRSAALAGAASTAHAQVAGGSPQGPRPTNLVLIGGGAADETELCAPVERGVYVTRLWYWNVVRPKEALITAVTRDGTFLIEDGMVTRPLHDLRLTDSVLSILADVQELAARPLLTSEGEFYGRRFATGVVCPAIRVGAVRFGA